MDLNLDNYSLSELMTILQISKNEINIPNLQKCLYDKIEHIKAVDKDDLPERKDLLIEFYTKCMFKLLNNISIFSASNKSNASKSDNIVRDFENIGIGNSFTQKPVEFISVKEQLLPALQNGPTIQENSTFVTRHNDFPSVNTFNSNLKLGDINPLVRKSFKKILNINTKFRENYTTTLSTNYIMELPSTVKKVVAMKLVDIQLTSMVYTVSSKLGSNTFIVNGISIIIPDGNYSSTTITVAINLALTNASINVTLAYNSINGLMTFTDMSGANFTINFDYNNIECPQLPSNIYKDQLTLGWILGFRQNYKYRTPLNATQPYPNIMNTLGPNSANQVSNSQIKTLSKINNRRPTLTQVKANGEQYFELQYNCCEESTYQSGGDISFNYSGSGSYTAESMFDSHGAKYFLIAINDFKNNHNSVFISPFQYKTSADNNIIAKIPIECCKSGTTDYPERVYFGPIDLAKLEIKLYDDFGRIIDNHNADYSLSLELEVLYDL